MSSPPERAAGDGKALAGFFSVEGKTVLVTGASVGIGRMIAEGFVRAGSVVYLVARRADDCERIADELSADGQCYALPGDLSSEDGCRAVADAFASRNGQLDVLINNAGTIRVIPFDEHSDALWDKTLALNLKAVSHLTRFLLPMLENAASVEDPARIINVGSIDATRVPHMDSYAYTASKAGVQHLTRHLAWRLAPRISVNCIAPGTFPSRMSSSFLDEHHDEVEASIPMRRLGRMEDAAGTAIFLASRAGSYITGAIVPVDGGLDALS